jgi:hypothetical protein
VQFVLLIYENNNGSVHGLLVCCPLNTKSGDGPHLHNQIDSIDYPYLVRGYVSTLVVVVGYLL